MAQGNMFYDTRNNKVYTAEELTFIDNASKKFIKRVPEFGIIKNGYYVGLNSDRQYQVETDRIISIVNRHHIENKANEYARPKQAPGNYLDKELYVYNAVFRLNKELEDNPNFHVDELRKEAIAQIRKDLGSNDNYSYLTSEDIERAFEKSANGQPIKEKYIKKEVKRIAIAVAISLLSVATIVGIIKIKDTIVDNRSISKASTAIYQLSYDENDKEFLESAYKDSRAGIDLVSQNTARTQTHQYYFFNNNKIAEDILKLPYYAIDMGVYKVYVDMGPDRENPGHPNLDEVIQSLNRLTKDNEILHEKFANCSTFNDYLIHNGFYHVDESNKKIPDVNRWLDFQRNALINYQAKLESDAKSHVSELYIGGK